MTLSPAAPPHAARAPVEPSLISSLFPDLRWSTEDAVANSATVVCPDPEGGVYDCGVQVRPQMIKTKGKVHRYYKDMCPGFDDKGWEDFEVEAPYMDKGGANEDANAVASFEACIRSCPEDAEKLDCEGVKNAQAKGVPLCPDTARKHDFKDGWCTAHIIQRQRWQGAVGNRYALSLRISSSLHFWGLFSLSLSISPLYSSYPSPS